MTTTTASADSNNALVQLEELWQKSCEKPLKALVRHKRKGERKKEKRKELEWFWRDGDGEMERWR